MFGSLDPTVIGCVQCGILMLFSFSAIAASLSCVCFPISSTRIEITPRNVMMKVPKRIRDVFCSCPLCIWAPLQLHEFLPFSGRQDHHPYICGCRDSRSGTVKSFSWSWRRACSYNYAGATGCMLSHEPPAEHGHTAPRIYCLLLFTSMLIATH